MHNQYQGEVGYTLSDKIQSLNINLGVIPYKSETRQTFYQANIVMLSKELSKTCMTIMQNLLPVQRKKKDGSEDDKQ